MKTHFVTIISMLLIASFTTIQAQTIDPKLQMSLEETKARLAKFDTEHLLDSLDQEKLPRIVSGGVFGGGNISNFIITRDKQTMSSYMRIGAEFGGYLDFNLSKHFVIEPQVIFTAQQNRYEENDTANHLWSFGAEIPILFMGRFGNMEKGYIQFGGGIFTHFTFASNIKGIYNNVDKSAAAPTRLNCSSPALLPAAIAGHDYSRLTELHNNHFGVCAQVGYETPFSMIINVSYKISLSDITTFYSENKGTAVADAHIYPQSITLSVGYHWR